MEVRNVRFISFSFQVNELWSFDLSTYTWEFLNTSLWCSVAPQPREQHSAVNIGGDVYIFGGKSRPFNVSSDIVYGDIWKLAVEKVFFKVLPS
jgi:hypothetical protein